MTAVLNAPSPLTRSAGGLRGRRVLPGFNLTLGYTLVYLSLIVLIPLSALVLKSLTLTWDQFWAAISSPRVLASYRLTFGASLIAAGHGKQFAPFCLANRPKQRLVDVRRRKNSPADFGGHGVLLIGDLAIGDLGDSEIRRLGDFRGSVR